MSARLATLLLAALLGWLTPAGMLCAQGDEETAPGSGVLVLRDAQAVLRPDGAPESGRALKLSHRWDQEFPGRAGQAEYRLVLPPSAGGEPMALLFSRVGNQVAVAVNGMQVMTRGHIGEPDYDAAKAPQFTVVPASLLRADGPNELVVSVAAQPLRWGGLSAVRYGPERLLQAEYTAQRHWRSTASLVFCVTLALMGLMALALWARLRDRLFACFAAAALLGIARNLDRIWPGVPVPWPLWGMFTAATYAWHLALMFVFALLALEIRRPLLNLLLAAYLPLSLALAVASFALGYPYLWTAALLLIAPLGIAVWAVVVRQALGCCEGRTTARVLAVAGALALLAGLHDLGLVRLGLGGPSRFSLTPQAIFVFVLIMAGIIVDRYARNAAGLKTLNQTLDARIHAKEMELKLTFGRLQAQEAAQATASERQRIMRDLHDGVGAQLVGLLSLIRQPGARQDLLREHVEAALDEMRLAVDSMQIGDGDLVTALATLRYRVQPRMQAAGLAMHWAVDDIPAMSGMSPRSVLQVQRILLEALTNVLKHAKADAVWINCALAPDSGTLHLELADNGVGMDAGAGERAGQGLKNMRARAESIGARLDTGERPGGGSLVRLEWPLQGQR